MRFFTKRVGLGLLVLGSLIPMTFAGSVVAAGPPSVGLGTADSYAVLAGDTITNTGPTTINGDLGLHPGTSVTGAPTVNGTSNVANGAAQQAKADLRTAYLDAAGRPGPILVAARRSRWQDAGSRSLQGRRRSRVAWDRDRTDAHARR